jgi:hypothetical protein
MQETLLVSANGSVFMEIVIWRIGIAPVRFIYLTIHAPEQIDARDDHKSASRVEVFPNKWSSGCLLASARDPSHPLASPRLYSFVQIGTGTGSYFSCFCRRAVSYLGTASRAFCMFSTSLIDIYWLPKIWKTPLRVLPRTRLI